MPTFLEVYESFLILILHFFLVIINIILFLLS